MKTEHQPAPSGQAFNTVKEIEANVKTRMEKAVADLQHDMASIRTGPRLAEHSGQHPRGLLRHAHAAEPGRQPARSRAVADHGPAVGRFADRADREGHPGFRSGPESRPTTARSIRLPIPPLTEERRKELVKRLHGVAENHRVAVRNIRRDGNEAVKKLLKDKKITEDEEQRAHDEIQKMTDAYMQKSRPGIEDQREGHPGDPVEPHGVVHASGCRRRAQTWGRVSMRSAWRWASISPAGSGRSETLSHQRLRTRRGSRSRRSPTT